jgi:hypothetical protein
MNERLCETTIHFNVGNGTYFFSTKTLTFPEAELWHAIIIITYTLSSSKRSDQAYEKFWSVIILMCNTEHAEVLTVIGEVDQLILC